MKFKTILLATVIGLSVLACPVLYVFVGPELDNAQEGILNILVIIALCSFLYCFIAGELTGNNSQMDKLWSILPAVYTWVIAIKGGMTPRLLFMAVLATIWGIRLTFNFARKGAYSLRFWEGKEDYRWTLLRGRKEFQPRWKWILFDLLFISFYQNLLVLMTTFPALVCVNSPQPLNWYDILAGALMAAFILYETIADEQQWAFQSKKAKLLKGGTPLELLPAPYNRGFNTTGLWSVSRHPNYFAEQGIWVSFYVFSIAAGIGLINWSMVGALLLIVLFQGSSSLGEAISSSKYPEYARYIKEVSRFFPGKKFR